MGQMSGRVERWEVLPQLCVTELENLFRLQDVAQTILAQRLQGGSLGQFLTGESSDGAAEQILLAVRRVDGARQPVQAGGGIVAVSRFGCPGVKRHADARSQLRAGPRLA